MLHQNKTPTLRRRFALQRYATQLVQVFLFKMHESTSSDKVIFQVGRFSNCCLLVAIIGWPFLKTFLNSGGLVSDFNWWIGCYTNIAEMWIAGRDLSRETSRRILNKTLEDNWGSAIPYVQDSNYENDIAIRKYAFQQVSGNIRRLDPSRHLRHCFIDKSKI